MPRTREFDPETVLDVALDLFWSKGYSACSMADVVKESGVARYGLYQAFKDKDQLYYATLKRYHQKIQAYFVAPFCKNKDSFHTLEEHFALMLSQLENNNRQGCFAHQAAIERAGKDSTVRNIVNDIFNDMHNTYRALITTGINAGNIKSLPIEDLVIYVLGVNRALITMTKQGCSPEERRNYVRCALNLLKPSI